MRLLGVVVTLVICSLLVVETKPTVGVAVKVVSVPVPILVPKIDILGILKKVVLAKAALVGKVVKTKAAIVGGVLGAKATLVGKLLGSYSGPVIGVIKPPPLPVYKEPLYPASPPQPPSTSYGTPAE